MSKKISKSERIRQALALKSNAGVSAADLARALKVKPGLIYALKWKAKGGKSGKKNRKAQKQAAKSVYANNGTAVGVNSGAGLGGGPLASEAVASAQLGTLVQMITLLQEAAAVLNRIRGVIG